MKIVITGANGYVGRHLAEHLTKQYQVIALARTQSDAINKLDLHECHFGDLQDQAYLLRSINDADIIIHCAMSYTKSGAEDVQQEEKIVDSLLASNKRIIYTSSLFGALDGRLITETPLDEKLYWLFGQEQKILKNAGSVIRLGFVYGGSGGYFWDIVKPNPEGYLYLTGKKDFTWPMIHIFDLVNLYQAIIENGDTEIFHAWDGLTTQYFELYERIASLTGSTIINKEKHYASKFMLNSINVSNSNSLTLDWNPQQGSVETHLKSLIPNDFKLKH